MELDDVDQTGLDFSLWVEKDEGKHCMMRRDNSDGPLDLTEVGPCTTDQD